MYPSEISFVVLSGVAIWQNKDSSPFLFLSFFLSRSVNVVNDVQIMAMSVELQASVSYRNNK